MLFSRLRKPCASFYRKHACYPSYYDLANKKNDNANANKKLAALL